MSHQAQREFIREIRKRFTPFFKGREVKVLDIGSLDINGNNKMFFSSQFYIGCDLGPGKNVDIISKGHQLSFRNDFFDVVISCECFEHDNAWVLTINNMIRMLRPAGLMIFTCATTGRKEHGTSQRSPKSSPFTNTYYKNLTEDDFKNRIDFNKYFSSYEFNIMGEDIRFYGVKK
jgi:SAM-dependent methyltransferase